jgi:hypothetical protein
MISFYPQTSILSIDKKKEIVSFIETRFVDDVGGFMQTLDHPKTATIILTMQGHVLRPSQCYEYEDRIVSGLIFRVLFETDPIDDPDPTYDIFCTVKERKTANIQESAAGCFIYHFITTNTQIAYLFPDDCYVNEKYISFEHRGIGYLLMCLAQEICHKITLCPSMFLLSTPASIEHYKAKGFLPMNEMVGDQELWDVKIIPPNILQSGMIEMALDDTNVPLFLD